MCERGFRPVCIGPCPHSITWYYEGFLGFPQASEGTGSKEKRKKNIAGAEFPTALTILSTVLSSRCIQMNTAQTCSALFTLKHRQTVHGLEHSFIIIFLFLARHCLSSLSWWACAWILICRAAELWGNESLSSGFMAPLVTHPRHTPHWDASIATVPMGNTIATDLTVRSKNSPAEFLHSWYSLHHTLRLIRISRVSLCVAKQCKNTDSLTGAAQREHVSCKHDCTVLSFTGPHSASFRGSQLQASKSLLFYEAEFLHHGCFKQLN